MSGLNHKLYYAFVVLLTFVVSLAAVSFAYYTPDTNYSTDLEVGNQLIKLQSDDLFENEVIVEAQSVKVININVLNGSDNNSSFKVSYTSDKPLVDVYTLDNLKDNILSNSMQSYEVILENYEDSASTFHFNLTIGEYDELIEVDDIPLRIGE